MPQNPFDRIPEYYGSLIEKWGHDPRACDYGQQKSQGVKFKVLSEVCNLSGKSILDVGCGFADFADFLLKDNPDIKYHGVDITPAMIKKAKELNPHLDLQVLNILDVTNSPLYDIVTANGIFYLLGDQAYPLMKQMISKMYEICREAVSFNSLSIWASNKEATEFYADPCQIIEHCRTLTPSVVFRHDYHSRDFTIYLYKNT